MVDFLVRHIGEVAKASWLNDSSFVLANMALQPVPVKLQTASALGAGTLHVDPAGGDRIWIEYSLVWTNALLDEQMISNLEKVIIAGRANQTGNPTNWPGADPYVPIFANNAQSGQEIFESYGPETFAKLKSAREKYDPDMWLQRGRPGFKLELDDAES